MSVSVIIPVLNGEAFIERAVCSALTQAVASDLQVIVADNGSTDATWSVLASLAAKDSRVFALRAAGQRGAAFARNACLEVATGNWVAVLDADDRMHPDRLPRLLAFAERRNADLVADNLALHDAAGNFLRPAWQPRQLPDSIDAVGFIDFNLRVTKGHDLGFCKPLFRRELIQAAGLRYQTSLLIGEDSYFTFSLLRAGARMHLCQEALYHYFQMPGSQCRRWGEAHSRALLAVVDADLAGCSGDGPVVQSLRRLRRALRLQLRQFAFVRAVKARRFDQALALVAATPAVIPRVMRSAREAVAKRWGRVLAGENALPPWIGEV